MVSKKTVNTLLASAVALTIAGAAGSANAMDKSSGKEKCYGVVKAGQNDCAAADKSHSCMGHATKDGDPNEWVALPEGVCDKLVSGSTTPGGDAEAMHDGEEHGGEDHQ